MKALVVCTDEFEDIELLVTSHNFLNIEKNLRKLVTENMDKKREDVCSLCEQLVRAYDPHFSCSVH